MLKGGYQIIDFYGEPQTLNIGTYVRDIYKKISRVKKAILISGLVVNNVAYHDGYTIPKKSGSGFTMDFADFVITVTNTDIVTISKKPSTPKTEVLISYTEYAQETNIPLRKALEKFISDGITVEIYNQSDSEYNYFRAIVSSAFLLPTENFEFSIKESDIQFEAGYYRNKIDKNGLVETW